jgi:hypothetical protein
VKAGFLDPAILARGPLGIAPLWPTDFPGAGIDNKNFSEKMKRHGVTLEAFKMYPPS